jgi:hypothetical protein
MINPIKQKAKYICAEIQEELKPAHEKKNETASQQLVDQKQYS